MYFHVVIETNEKAGKGGSNKEYVELDKADISEIEERIVAPYCRGDDVQFDGYFLSKKEIKRIAIKETSQTSEKLTKYVNDRMPAGVFCIVSPSSVINSPEHAKDITVEVFERVRGALKSAVAVQAPTETPKQKRATDRSRVFIVHGRDDLAKVSAALFVQKLGLLPIILHEQVNGGNTIIEKIEEHTNVGFAMVLYTPCDTGNMLGESPKPRARQNVVFEHGYLIGKLGRPNVCALVKPGVEVPNDISGVVYVPLDDHGAWHVTVAKELRNAGYDIDMNKVF